MQKTLSLLLLLLMLIISAGCTMPETDTQSENNATDDTTNNATDDTTNNEIVPFLPEFYQGLSGAKSIEFPAVSDSAQIYESMYPQFAPALLKLKANSVYKIEETISTSFYGTPVSIKTSKSGDNIVYTITDNDNCLNIEMIFNTKTCKFDYRQSSIVHVPANVILGSNIEQYSVVFVDMTDITVDTDLILHGNYSLTYYRKDASGTCMIFSTDKVDFYSSADINGFAYNNFTVYSGDDIRPVDETPSTLNSDNIKTVCLDTIKTSGITKAEYNSMWYKKDAFSYAGVSASHTDVAAMIAAMPWTPIF